MDSIIECLLVSQDFLPTATIETLKQRAELLAAIRAFFNQSGYWEVETPILSHDIVIDAYLDPFLTNFHREDEKTGEKVYLQTSPEFAMKRLLTANSGSIFEITRSFRNGETGTLHNPEFTMLEWYAVGQTYQQQIKFVKRLLQHVASVATSILCHPSPLEIFLKESPPKKWTYQNAFQTACHLDVLNCSLEELKERAQKHQLSEMPPETDVDFLRNYLLVAEVEPLIAEEKHVYLYDYPASQAALATVRNDDTPVAERFELYLKGIEICNGYQELTDPAELRIRMAKQQQIRQAAGKSPLPEQNRLLQAMEHGLPKCAGVALGVDRLIMLSLGKETIQEVIPFPFPIA